MLRLLSFKEELLLFPAFSFRKLYIVAVFQLIEIQIPSLDIVYRRQLIDCCPRTVWKQGMFYCLSYATVGLVGSLILMCGYVFARQGDLVGGEIFGIPPEVYNPLNEPSPLGLRLKKSESFVELVQMKLSQEPTLKSSTSGNKTHKGVAADKLKASNFPASVLKIGAWEVDSFDHLV